jgi:hypothetical protein
VRSAADGQQALDAALRDEDPLVAPALADRTEADPADADRTEAPAEADLAGPAQLAATGPRSAARAGDYELLLEMILEGTRLHYGAPRVFATEDPDLRLLLGDRLYASGLARLAAIGDLEAVAELADLISLLAQAQARDCPELADAIWAAGGRAIGWGSTPSHEAAKALARQEDDRAQEALLRAADGPAR